MHTETHDTELHEGLQVAEADEGRAPPMPGMPAEGGTGRHEHIRRLLSSLALLPNQITAFRLLLLPLLWVLAVREMSLFLAIGIVVAGLSDVLDGIAARRLRQVTAFGSQFDSVVDHLLNASIVLWLLLLRPEFFREQLVPLLIWGVLGLATLATGWIRFRRIADLHLYSAKAATLAGYAFAVLLLALGDYSRTLFYLVLAIGLLAQLETLLVFLTRSRIEPGIGSVFRRLWNSE